MFWHQEKHSTSAERIDLTPILSTLEKMCDGDYTLRINLPKDNPLAPVSLLINRLMDNHESQIKRLTMDLNNVVYEGVHSGNYVNQLSSQFEILTSNFEQIATAVTQLSESVSDFAQTIDLTANQTDDGKISITETNSSISTVIKETSNSQ
ncbi:methyl-accepting chemotaxis protein, partial [Heliobacterium chlorum]